MDEIESDELNQAYNDSLIEQMYGGGDPQGTAGGSGAAMEGTGSDAGSSFGSIDWGGFIRRLLTGAHSAAGSGALGGLDNPAGLAGGALMAKLLYERFKELEGKAEALRTQAEYTPAPLYARQLQSPIYGRGGIGEALYFNPNPFQYNAEQARQQSNMAVPQDASRPKPTMPAYTTIPTTPREQPQYISNLLSSFQSPVSFAPNLTGNTRMPTMQGSVAPYVVSRAEGGPIYDVPDESLGYARGGIAGMLRGPGDGMSDHIPATIQGKQPARLSDGEFVVPADVVSHLGNGSSKAGAEHLYSMMNKVREDRTGRTEQAKQINPNKYLRG